MASAKKGALAFRPGFTRLKGFKISKHTIKIKTRMESLGDNSYSFVESNIMVSAARIFNSYVVLLPS